MSKYLSPKLKLMYSQYLSLKHKSLNNSSIDLQKITDIFIIELIKENEKLKKEKIMANDNEFLKSKYSK